MRRITSIRPGEPFQGQFASYPAATLLMDLLRSNVSGALEVEPPPLRATFYFRQGVPISSTLEAAAAPAALSTLVAEAEGDFRFTEGAAPPPGTTRVVLRTLPILFEGYCRPAARGHIDAFIETHRRQRLRLTDTYPRGANPLGLPATLLEVVNQLESPTPVDTLIDGLSADATRIGATLLTLWLAEMLAAEEEAPAALSEPSDLVLDDHPGTLVPGTEMPNREVQASTPTSGLDALKSQRAEIARAVDPLRGKDYLEILRVKPDTKPDQIERSRNYLSKQLAKGEGPGPDAVRELLEEAFVVLTDPVKGAEYRKLAKNATTQKTLRKRQAFEAIRKLNRATAKIAQGAFGPASYLIEWAAALDPDLVEVEGHRHFLEFCLQPGPSKPEFAVTLRLPMESLVERAPSSQHLRLYLVILYVAMKDRDRAKALFAGLTGAETHPLFALAQVAVAALD